MTITARANRTLAARDVVDAAGDALTEIYDALRSADGMPTRAQLIAFSRAAGDVWDVICDAQYENAEEDREATL